MPRPTPWSTRALGSLVLAATLTSIAALDASAVQLAGRIGLAAPVQGDTQDQLDLGPGLGAGASLGVDLAEFLSVDLRYDAILLFGSVSGGADSSWTSHGVTLGPQLEFHQDAFGLYLGVHPGVYFTQLGLDGTISLPRPRDINVDSDWSIDFGLNTELGARWFLSDQLFLGTEVAYHLVLLNDDHLGFDVEGTEFKGGKIDDSAGALTVGMTFGYRF